jgi:hypothetical protein
VLRQEIMSSRPAWVSKKKKKKKKKEIKEKRRHRIGSSVLTV